MALPFFLLCLLPLAAHTYDIGCLYPPKMPDPLDAQQLIITTLSLPLASAGLETPLIIHVANRAGACAGNCNAYHDPVALNVLTNRPTAFETPAFGHNSFSRALCYAQCLDTGTYLRERSPPLARLFASWGLVATPPDPEIAAVYAGGDTDALAAFVAKKDYHPFVIGQIVFLEALAFQKHDGWNLEGNLRFDANTGAAVNCTANCSPYTDPTGYAPVAHAENDTTSATAKRWQPLVELDQLSGAFKKQEHVTPHIGYTAKLFLGDSAKTAPDPAYDYHAEALHVVEETRATAQNDVRKESIRLFDQKLTVRLLIQEAIKKQFAASLSYEQHMLYLRALDLMEHDAVIHAWREKRRWDLLRPTTFIQRWGGMELLTFSGDREATEPELISARDFQAWQRVMPHSEYPSSSACLCQGYQEVTDAFVSAEFGGVSLNDIVFGPGGFQLDPRCYAMDLVPGKEPPVGCSAVPLTFKSLEDVKNVCGQSRLWGGMHFRASVKAGHDLCSGLGQRSYEMAKKFENSSNWTSSYKKGDPFPVCGSK